MQQKVETGVAAAVGGWGRGEATEDGGEGGKLSRSGTCGGWRGQKKGLGGVGGNNRAGGKGHATEAGDGGAPGGVL